MRKTLFTGTQRQGLREATYHVDAKARAEANKVWDGVIRYIEEESKDDPPFHYMRKHPSTGGFAIVWHNVPGLPGDLGIILAPSKGRVHGTLTQSTSGQSVIIVYGALQHPHHTEYLDIRIKGPSYRKTFVHEYVHYLDQRRNPTLMKSGDKAAQADRAGNRAAYFQTPAEFNAWFQGTAQEIEDAVDREEENIHSFGKKHKRFRDHAVTKLRHMHERFKTFHDFMTWIKTLSFETDEMMDHLKGSKWERKWLKRMATLYRGLKPRVLSISIGG